MTWLDVARILSSVRPHYDGNDTPEFVQWLKTVDAFTKEFARQSIPGWRDQKFIDACWR